MPSRREVSTIIEHIGLWKKKDIQKALEEQNTSGRPLKDIFQKMGLLPFGDVPSALFFQLGIVQAELPQREIPTEILQLVPPKMAKNHRIIPFEMRGPEKLILATDDPLNILATEYFQKTLMLKVEPDVTITFRQDIDQLIEKHYGAESEDIASMLQEVSSTDVVSGGESEDVLTDEDEEALALQAPIVKITNLIMVEALRKRASDIHLEPLENRFRIRYRIDGVLYEVISPPRRIQRAIIARVKLMAKMNLAEKRLPQDGRIMLEIAGRPIDFRVSALPGIFGESMVLRILDKTTMLKDLEQLGFFPADMNKWGDLLKYSGGLLLVTGPTGSGKTTTLYAALKKLNTSDRKLMTVEEPVEYQISGINQTPVKGEIGLSFSKVLRSFLRQAPDVLLVGEIRDFETADIALRAALTGHLVFSTLHTNDAPSAITRLIDLGIPPFLVASGVQGVMAQRLVRVLCPYCKEKAEPDEMALRFLTRDGESNGEMTLFAPKGCAECNFTGFLGRLGVFEIFIMSDELRHLALERASASKVREIAVKQGMRTMVEDGLEKVRKGITTLKEVFEVVGELQ